MKIISKYNGTCRKCGGKIFAGEQIEWSKESGANHLACPSSSRFNSKTAPTSKTSQKPSTKSASKPTIEEIDKIVVAAGRVRAARMDGTGPVSDTASFTRQGKSGPQIGAIITSKFKGSIHPFVVVFVSQPRYHSETECEDMDCFCHKYGWQVSYEAIRVAPSTEEVAKKAELATLQAKKELVIASLRWDAPGVSVLNDTGSRPQNPELTWIDKNTTYDLTPVSIVAHNPGNYDDYRSTTCTLSRQGNEQIVEALQFLSKK